MATKVHDGWGIGTLPHTRADVATLINYCGFMQQQTTRNQLFKMTRLAEIEDMMHTTQAQEDACYDYFKVSGLKELNDRILKIINNPVIQAMNNKANTGFTDMVVAASKGKMIEYNKIVDEKLDNAVSYTFSFFLDDSDKVKDIVNRQFEEGGIKDGIIQLFHNTTINLNSVKTIRVNAGEGRGLSNIFTKIQYNEELSKKTKGKQAFTVTINDSYLNTRWSNRLQKDLNETLGFEYYTTIGTPIDMIYNYLKGIARGIDKEGNEVEEWVFKELEAAKRNKKLYDINVSFSSIAGFLGEVRTAAIINCLAKQRIVIPTGALKELKSGEEIPIDLVIKTSLNSANIQVKNYRELQTDKGSFVKLGQREKDTMLMKNFIDLRLRDSNAITLKTLFASYHYNVISKKGKETFSDIRSELVNLAEKVSPEYFNNFLDNIIRLSDFFQAKSNPKKLFIKQDLYINTFYFFGDKIIPATTILESLYNQIAQQSTDDLLTSSFLVSDEPGDPNFPQRAKGKFNDALDHVKVHYEITLNVEKLFDEAIAKAQKGRIIKLSTKL